MPVYFHTGEISYISSFGGADLSVEWQIPNFPSLLLSGDEDCYLSPDFRSGEEIWYLSVWPNWRDESLIPASGWVSLDLRRVDDGLTKTFYVSVGIRGSGGVEKCREGVKEFWGTSRCDWNAFCSRSELVEHKTRLMPDGTLTIACVIKSSAAATGILSLPHLSGQIGSTIVAPTNKGQSSDKQDSSSDNDSSDDSRHGVIGDLVEITTIGAEELTVQWSIGDVLMLRSGSEDMYESPTFRFGDEIWYLCMWPNWTGESLNPSSGWVEIDLGRLDDGPAKVFHVAVGIRGSGGEEKRGEVEKEFSSDDSHHQWHNFCSRSDLLYQKTRLMPDDVLTITCVIKRASAATACMNNELHKKEMEPLMEQIKILQSSVESHQTLSENYNSTLQQQISTLNSELIPSAEQYKCQDMLTIVSGLEKGFFPNPHPSNQRGSTVIALTNRDQTSDKQENISSQVPFLWRDKPTKLLLRLYEENKSKFNSVSFKKKTVWQMIAQAMQDNNYPVSSVQCENKFKGLANVYKKINDQNYQNGNRRRSFNYMEQMYKIFEKDTVIHPVPQAPSSEDFPINGHPNYNEDVFLTTLSSSSQSASSGKRKWEEEPEWFRNFRVDCEGRHQEWRDSQNKFLKLLEKLAKKL